MQPYFIPSKIEIGRSTVYLSIETRDNLLRNGLQLLVADFFKTLNPRAYQQYLISFIDRKTVHTGCPNCRWHSSRNDDIRIIDIILDEHTTRVKGNVVPRRITVANFHTVFNKLIKSNNAENIYNYGNQVLCTPCQLKKLGKKSKEVLDLIMAGKNAKDISGELKIDEKTVSRHKRIIMEKMGVTNLQFLHKRFINC